MSNNTQFLSKDGVSWLEFEKLCEDNKVSIPQRSIEWGRQNVLNISSGNISVKGNKPPSNIFNIKSQLANKLWRGGC